MYIFIVWLAGSQVISGGKALVGEGCSDAYSGSSCRLTMDAGLTVDTQATITQVSRTDITETALLSKHHLHIQYIPSSHLKYIVE